jgi:hypothetical protein
MATLIPCVKNDFIKSDSKCNIKIRLSHDRKVRYLKTTYYVEPGMLGRNGKVKPKHPNYIQLNTALTKFLEEYNSVIAGIVPDIRYMDINTLTYKLRYNESNGASFLNYANRRIKELYEEGRSSIHSGNFTLEGRRLVTEILQLTRSGSYCMDLIRKHRKKHLKSSCSRSRTE